jgi:hypothetical protein
MTAVVDHRAADERSILRRLARALADAAEQTAAHEPALEAVNRAWLPALRELVSADKIVQSKTEGTSREYGANAEVQGGLWLALRGKFGVAWRERTELGQRVESSLEVTTEVLRAAVTVTLENYARHVMVVVFFDDLDQSQQMHTPESAKSVVQSVLDLPQCVAIVHLRSEVAYADWRREITLTIAVPGLTQADLDALLERRILAMSGPHQGMLREADARAPLRALMRATDNPYVLLRWTQALADAAEAWPPDPAWLRPDRLRHLVVGALNGPNPPDELLNALGSVLDRIERPDRGLDRADLARGRAEMDTAAVETRLTEAWIAWLERYELLVPIDRFDPSAGLRVDPILDLVRPSVISKLTSP